MRAGFSPSKSEPPFHRCRINVLRSEAAQNCALVTGVLWDTTNAGNQVLRHQLLTRRIPGYRNHRNAVQHSNPEFVLLTIELNQRLKLLDGEVSDRDEIDLAAFNLGDADRVASDEATTGDTISNGQPSPAQGAIRQNKRANLRFMIAPAPVSVKPLWTDYPIET